MAFLSTDDLDDARTLVSRVMAPTPARSWPLLDRRIGTDLFVKHENHGLTGAFKARGGIVYVEWLKRTGRLPAGLISATRGNHGLSLARAGQAAGLPVTIIVPHGNSDEKNAAMVAHGAELIIEGNNFEAARAYAERLALERGLTMVPAFHRALVAGVASYAHEFFDQVGKLDRIYVPVGTGTGLCGLIAVRDRLGLSTEIVGVVAEQAPVMARAWVSGRDDVCETARTFADGVALSSVNAEACALIRAGVSDIVTIDEEAIAEAMRILHTDTHNLAEPAGALALAAALAERGKLANRRVGMILSGGNVDLALYARVLAGETPRV